MEIFSKINEIMSTYDILYKFPLAFVENYIIMNLFLTVLNICTSKKNKFLYVVILTLISTSTRFLIPNPFNLIINNLLSFLLIIILFKVSPFKALICLVSSVAIFGIISSLVLNPYITIFKITSEQLSNTAFYNIGFLITTYAINLILIFILKSKKLKINLFEDIDKKNKSIIFTNFVFGAVTLAVQVYITVYYIDRLPIIITFFSCVSLFAYLIISIYSLTRVMKLTLTTRKLESAEEYNKTLRILHDSVRGFKHDFDNIVTTIGGYVRTNDMEGLKSYYIQLEDDCQRVNNLYLLNPEIVNNPRYL